MKILQNIFQNFVTLFFKLFFYFVPTKEIPKNLEKTIDLYKGGGFSETFAKIRVWDAPYELVDKLIPRNAVVLDLGCGDGTLANYLALSSSKRRIYGFDINKRRVKEAKRGIKNVKFQYGDITKIKLIKPNVLILAHVLHHLRSRDAQIEFLEKVSKSMKKGSEVVILEINNKPFLKYVFTWLTDAITVPILFEQKLFDFNFFFRIYSEWKKILSELDFDIKTRSVHRGMPFSHILIYGKKLS